MEEQEIAVLRSCPLFSSYPEKKLPSLMEKCASYRCRFSLGEHIPFRKEASSRIGILLEGKAKVFSAEDEKTILNRLEPGNLFGVSSLYSGAEADTVIVAAAQSTVLFIDEGNMDPLFEDRKTRENLISFLTGRIRFLTEKIASFTAGSAEQKLAHYLTGKVDESGLVSSFRSYSELAKSLNLGRASLYRALEKMEEEGAIRRGGKGITVLSPEKLGRHLQHHS